MIAPMRLPQCQRNNLEEYWWVWSHGFTRTYTITTIKQTTTTPRAFYGIYSRSLGWGLLKPHWLTSPLRKFSILGKYMLDSSNHIHILQMLPQPSCKDICQIWRWYSTGNQFFYIFEKLGKSHNGGNWSSNPTHKNDGGMVNQINRWYFGHRNSETKNNMLLQLFMLDKRVTSIVWNWP